MDFIISRKGSDMISYEGFLYRKDKTKLNTINWRCAKTGCKGRLTTSLQYREQQQPLVSSGVHTHPPNPLEVAARRVENSVKTAAVRTRNPPRRIVQDALTEVNEEVAAAVGSSTNLRQTIRRKRKATDNNPPAPVNVGELFIPDMLRQTTDQRGFLLYDSGSGDVHRMLIFSTDQFLQTLHDSEHWMCDGTFKVSPSLFYQVYTVHAMIRNNVLPCIFVLLPNKQQVTYSQMWTEIKSLKPGLAPRSVQIDFELASKAALIEAFPQTHIYGCYFHLGQSLWRKIQENGLQRLNVQDDNIRMALKMLLALAFLPVDEVSDAFDELVADYPAEVMPLVNYFEDNYVGRRNRRGDRRQPLFPVHMWSVKARQDAGLPRTNNQLESWHNAFQGSTETHHPSIFRFIEALRREEALQRANRTQLLQGRDLTQRMKRYVTMNTRITVVQQNRGQYDLRQFLRALAHNLEINMA
ncbi:uncharacterized protein LOC143466174 [Clavelina lepadiformis]|uniref:uncharacterized protein LOC143466174 n=1 Tax=Clavelina lepadiformis TaxID=159417 RepID=UPI00404339BB